MIGISANPDSETLKILLWALISLIAMLILIVGYFITKRERQLDEDIKTITANLVKANHDFTEVVEQLKLVVQGLMSQYTIRQPIIDDRLNKHAKVLNSHSERLKVLETEHKMIHCNYQPKNE